MTPQELRQNAIAPAIALLGLQPSVEADVLLLAIAQQESLLMHRVQLVGNPPEPKGPAKSLWQAERGGGMVSGVRVHPATKAKAALLYAARGVAPTNDAIWNAIENDDVLAAGLARLLLLSDPATLPSVGDETQAWEYYLRTWRPGAWSRGTPEQRKELRAKWGRSYGMALRSVQ